MKKNFIILTEFFPYLNKEPFLESEVNYYKDYNTHIFSCSADNSMSEREIKQQNILYFAQEKERNHFRKVFRYLKAVFSTDFIKEIFFLIKKNKLNFTTIKQLLSFVSFAKYKCRWIKKELNSLGFNEDSNFVIYSYWMH